MKVNIIDLNFKNNINKTINIVMDISRLHDGYDYVYFSKPVIVKGSLNLVDEIICLEATVSTELKLTCSRCMEQFNYPFEIQVKESFTTSNDVTDNTEDTILLVDGKLDLYEVIENNIFVSLPLTRLCKEDCMGLCQVCGIDLNNSSCNCKNESIDPRLEKLKDLFS